MFLQRFPKIAAGDAVDDPVLIDMPSQVVIARYRCCLDLPGIEADLRLRLRLWRLRLVVSGTRVTGRGRMVLRYAANGRLGFKTGRILRGSSSVGYLRRVCLQSR